MFDSNSIKIEKILFSNCLKHRHKINGLVMLGLVPNLDYYIFVAAKVTLRTHFSQWRHDIQHDGIRHNDTLHDDI